MARTKAALSSSVKKQAKRVKAFKTKPLKTGDNKGDDSDKKKPLRKHRFKSGTRARMDIRRLQKGVNLLVPKKSMENLIREILYDVTDDMRLKKNAILALHTASEYLLLDMFQKTRELLSLTGMKGIRGRDFRFAASFYMKDLPAPVKTEV
jgi:histone H3/H4